MKDILIEILRFIKEGLLIVMSLVATIVGILIVFFCFNFFVLHYDVNVNMNDIKQSITAPQDSAKVVKKTIKP